MKNLYLIQGDPRFYIYNITEVEKLHNNEGEKGLSMAVALPKDMLTFISVQISKTS